jgi:hypothetical protein
MKLETAVMLLSSIVYGKIYMEGCLPVTALASGCVILRFGTAGVLLECSDHCACHLTCFANHCVPQTYINSELCTKLRSEPWKATAAAVVAEKQTFAACVARSQKEDPS